MLCYGNAMVDAVLEGVLSSPSLLARAGICNRPAVTQALQHDQIKKGNDAFTALCRRDTDVKIKMVQAIWDDPNAKHVVGGGALNSARLASWLFERKLPVSFLGCVADDDKAKMIENVCENGGVTALLEYQNHATNGKLEHASSGHADIGTGVCAVVIDPDTRDRTMLGLRGAGETLNWNAAAAVLVRGNAQEAPGLPGEPSTITRLVYASVFNLTTPSRAHVAMELANRCHPTPETEELFELEQQQVEQQQVEQQQQQQYHEVSDSRHEAVFCLGFSSSFIVPLVKDQIAELLPRTDVVICDAGELAAWVSAQQEEVNVKPDESNWRDKIENNASQLLNELRSCGIVVVTDGANGCVVASMNTTETTGDSVIRSYPVPHEWKLEVEQICDTTGAGDAFAAGFLGTLSACALNGIRFDMSEAVRLGQYCAFEILKQQGVQVPNFAPKTRISWPRDKVSVAA